LLPALHPVQSLSREDIIIFAVTAAALEIKSGPPATVAGTGEPDPRGKTTVTWCDPRRNYMRRRGKEHCARAMSAFIFCSLCDVTVGGILMKWPRHAQKWGVMGTQVLRRPSEPAGLRGQNGMTSELSVTRAKSQRTRVFELQKKTLSRTSRASYNPRHRCRSPQV
jgi:hypothetical protein